MYRKKDFIFTSVEDPTIIERFNQNLTPHLIQSRLDYWALRLGPGFSTKERQQTPIRYEYSLSQIEYALDIAFKRRSHLKNMFDRACELGLLISSADLNAYEHAHLLQVLILHSSAFMSFTVATLMEFSSAVLSRTGP